MDATAIRAILGDTWAIRPEALDGLIAIASSDSVIGDIQALEQKYSEYLKGTNNATIRDGVAIVSIAGPLMRYETFFSWLFGRSTYGSLAIDLRAAADDPSVKAILLQIDSPGGMVNGVNELAQQIRSIRGVKPVVAYVGGDAASAAYWLASAADEIVADETAVVGSIGAMIGLSVMNGEGPGVKRFTFTSSQSPLKNASPGTADGNREYQRLVDELAQVFIEQVASNRNIKVDEVLEKYGQGAVYSGNEALKRGMIDSIGTFESVLSRLSGNQSIMKFSKMGAKAMLKNEAGAEIAVPETVSAAWVAENFPGIAESFRAEGVASVDAKASAEAARVEGAKAERDRLSAIEALAMPGTEAVIAECKADPEMTAEKASMKILLAIRANPAAAQPANAGAAHLAGLKQTEASLEAPAAGSGGDKPVTVEEAAKAAIEMARKSGIDA